MQELIKSIEFLLFGPKGIDYARRGLKYWACWKAYQNMIEYVKEAKTHPGLSEEVSRMPQLLDLFVEHLNKRINMHIDIETMTIFSVDVIGPGDLWREWQETGYSRYRDRFNYRKRLHVWRNLFRANKGNFEKIIAERNKYIVEATFIPYWYLWNYGSASFGSDGFPSYQGLFFVERAHNDLRAFIPKALEYLDKYAIYYLDGRKYVPVPFRDSRWLKDARSAGVL